MAMSWFDKLIPPGLKWSSGSTAKKVPEGVWVKCPSCETVLYSADLDANQHVCPTCDHHLRIGSRRRLELLLDPDAREELGTAVLPADPLKFRDSRKYSERLDAAASATGETEALLVMSGSIMTLPVIAAAFDFDFMGGSMGSVVGERFARGVQEAVKRRVPFVSIAASGGARMQEGLLSLMQMAKTTACLTQLSRARLPYISVLTDPTMGGVSASFCFLGDVVIAEPGALVGFAGQRVIEQTVRETLPEGFQRAEFLLEKGAIDMIVDRRKLRREIASLLALLQNHPADALMDHLSEPALVGAAARRVPAHAELDGPARGKAGVQGGAQGGVQGGAASAETTGIASLANPADAGAGMGGGAGSATPGASDDAGGGRPVSKAPATQAGGDKPPGSPASS